MELGKSLIILPICLFMYGQAMANTVGQASFVHGSVIATSVNDQERELTKGDEIYEQDNIKTNSDSRAQLQFTDGGSVSLMPNTNFSVQEYIYDNNDGNGSLVFNLLSGGMRTITGAIGKKDHANYELKTPVGTLGIRGTEYTAIMQSIDLLQVHVGRGRVVLTNEWGTVELAQGQTGTMATGSGPSLANDNDGDLLDEVNKNDASMPDATKDADPLFSLDEEADTYFGQPLDAITPDNGGGGSENGGGDFGNDDGCGGCESGGDIGAI